MRFAPILQALHARAVRFVIVGGLAVILHGVPRTTFDLDVLIDMTPGNVTALLDALAPLGFRPRLPVEAAELADPGKREAWVRDRNLKAFTFWRDGGDEIDVCLAVPITYEQGIHASTHLEAYGVPVHVVSIPHLILMKRAAARTQDLSDINALERELRILDEQGEAP